jgi:pimeloyl-ACP methyl ester carboxylesterase
LLYYTESGPSDAPAIVFLPGGGVSGWSWLPQVRRLTGYRCIVPDLPGHGRSPANGPIRISTTAEKVRVSVTLTRPYLDALDSLVERGIYLSRGST